MAQIVKLYGKDSSKLEKTNKEAKKCKSNRRTIANSRSKTITKNRRAKRTRLIKSRSIIFLSLVQTRAARKTPTMHRTTTKAKISDFLCTRVKMIGQVANR